MVNMEFDHSREQLAIPAQRLDSARHCSQAHRKPSVQTAAPLLSICIDGQAICQMPLKTELCHMQNPMELSIELSSGQRKKRLRTDLSEPRRYNGTRHAPPSQNCEYVSHLQSNLQPPVATQRFHLDEFLQNFHASQNPQIRQPGHSVQS